MLISIFVEGQSDCFALDALFEGWKKVLRQSGHGIQIVPLTDKARYLQKIGPRVAQKLIENASNRVVGLPDLYPIEPYLSTKWAHKDLGELRDYQTRAVEKSLRDDFGVNPSLHLSRFHPTALKHDLEMLLLAAESAMKSHLGCSTNLGNWRVPVEDQNHDRPPKRVVEEIFLTRSKTRSKYRDTVDAAAVLRRVGSMVGILKTHSGQISCPVFKNTLDWMAQQFGIPYS